MNLLDHSGMVWPLAITHLGDGRTVVTQGWKAFLEYYNLDTKKDDMDLEIIRTRGRDCKELKVHIINRVTPRRRGRPRKWLHPSKSKASDKLDL